MSLTLAILLIALFDALLIAGLVFVMALPRHLEPHDSTDEDGGGASVGSEEPASPHDRSPGPATLPRQGSRRTRSRPPMVRS